jgi:hypothetical protein
MANDAANISIPGLAISPNKAQSTTLLSGSVWPVPAGNFLLKLGKQLVCQYFDYNSGLWRSFESGGSNNPIDVSSDGTNFRVINISGTISGANVTTAGTLYSQASTTISFAAPNTSNFPSITATGTPIIGGSLSLTLTTAGTGYTNPVIIIPHPVLLGGAPGLCIPATFHAATLSTGGLSTFTTDFAGAGYLTAPTANTQTFTPAQFAANTSAILGSTGLVLIDPTGTGGVITPAITNGTPANGGLTGIIMNNNGAGYDGTHIPAVTITSTTTGINAAATSLPWMALSSVTVGGTNTSYSASILGVTSDANTAANNPPHTVYDDVPMVRNAWFMADESGGALGTPTVSDAGGGFQTVPLAKQVGNATADGSVNATFTAVVGGVASVLIYQQVG